MACQSFCWGFKIIYHFRTALCSKYYHFHLLPVKSPSCQWLALGQRARKWLGKCRHSCPIRAGPGWIPLWLFELAHALDLVGSPMEITGQIWIPAFFPSHGCLQESAVQTHVLPKSGKNLMFIQEGKSKGGSCELEQSQGACIFMGLSCSFSESKKGHSTHLI